MMTSRNNRILGDSIPERSYNCGENAIRYSDHQVDQGPAFHRHAWTLGLEGIASKRSDAGYSPGQQAFWLKTKCLNRAEFVAARFR
jgi:bifunctional non-homologous end joining protein LigD